MTMKGVVMFDLNIASVTGLLFIGCALRFLLPYLILGLETIGRENSLKAWPAWEWRYLTSLILSLIAYGVMMLLNPQALVGLLAMAPVQIVILAYAGQDVASRIQKPFRKQ